MEINYLKSIYNDEEKQTKLQENLAIILEELSYRFTEGRSFSIKLENAQGIVRSVLFAINLSGESEVYDYDDFMRAYKKGGAIIDELISASKELYDQVLGSALKTNLKAYAEMSDSGIGIFFAKYDKTYAATEIPVNIDYFLAGNNSKLEGVLYVKDFLECLLIENKFCGFYESSDIERLLELFGDSEAQVYSFLHPNIFELVLINSIFAILINAKPDNIILSEIHKSMIARKFEGIGSKDAIYDLDKAAEDLLEYWDIQNDTDAAVYIYKYIENSFKPRFKAALENDGIVNLPIFEHIKQNEEFSLSTNQKMPDSRFRAVIKKIESENDIDKKIEIIRRDISSLQDFIDIFKADIFYGDEINQIFKSLDSDEILILTKTVLYDYKGNEDFQKFINSAKSETKWEQQFIEFLRENPSFFRNLPLVN